jgi:hypothetical protein
MTKQKHKYCVINTVKYMNDGTKKLKWDLIFYDSLLSKYMCLVADARLAERRFI